MQLIRMKILNFYKVFSTKMVYENEMRHSVQYTAVYNTTFTAIEKSSKIANRFQVALSLKSAVKNNL